jgi:hypothetical protein
MQLDDRIAQHFALARIDMSDVSSDSVSKRHCSLLVSRLFFDLVPRAVVGLQGAARICAE